MEPTPGNIKVAIEFIFVMLVFIAQAIISAIQLWKADDNQ